MSSARNLTNPDALTGLPGYYFVYRATNKANGKVYIGITNDFTYRQYHHFLDARRGCPLHFHRAIRKHGEHAFEWAILSRCSCADLASVTEQKDIEFYDSYRNGYNMTTGGQQGWSKTTSEETKRKLALLYKGKTYEDIHGPKRAPLIRQKQSDAHRGRRFTEEHRKKLSEANKRRWTKGNIGRVGKPCEVFGQQFKNGREAADALNISSVTLRKWIKQGKNGARYL